MKQTGSADKRGASPGLSPETPIITVNFSDPVSGIKKTAYTELVGKFSYREIGNSTFLPLEIPRNRFLKRAIDVTFSFLFLVLFFSWMFPIIALWIKLSSRGPVFFLQKRSGRNNKLFTCIKFRTMIVNPEADLKPALENDSRITPLGKFLRNHYLDELPQLINVLWGDMSLIGPRPHMINDDLLYKEEIRNYDFRKKVKPGITGLAQVLGLTGPLNDSKKMEERVQLDIIYVRQWSPALDIKIFFRTIGRLFRI